MRRVKTWTTLVAVTALAALGAACAAVGGQTAEVRKPVHLTVFVYPAPAVEGGCGVVTIPQYAYARQNDDIVWDISSQTCRGAGEVTIDIEARVVEITEKTSKKKKGKVKGVPDVYTYRVKLASGFVEEDPEIEIW